MTWENGEKILKKNEISHYLKPLDLHKMKNIASLK